MEHFVEVAGLEGAGQVAHLVEDATKAPHVNFVSILMAHAHFRRQIIWSTRGGLSHIISAIKLLTDAKIATNRLF